MCVRSVTLNYVTFDLGIWHFGIEVYLDTVSVKFEARYCLLQFTIIGGTHTHPFNDPFSWTARLSQYQKGKTNLDFTEARDGEWQWHQLGHMQVCTSLQTDNHASTPSLSFYRPDDTQPTASEH